ncbi:MAG TPA: NAD(P)H-binding protein [Acidimicrobiales bacterium]|jgi:uncharacterized protein YbjT (DUF2867 family)|nr:NAD(P)H-binding protein [Acidimicrobiales bacterium]
MRVAVLGGTGVLGRHVVQEARARGFDVVSLSRGSGVDLVTGDGLAPALHGADAAIDVTNVMTVRGGPAVRFFESTARNLQSAATREGVAHLVVVSIVGVDRMGRFGYYGAKVTQERLHLDGPVDATILRATQFHEFPGQILSRSTFGPVAVVPALWVQTVAARSVAAALIDAAASGPFRGRLPDVAGPAPAKDLPALARAVLERTGRRSSVLPVPVPGAMGRAVRAGALLPAADGLLVGPTFEEWLAGPDGPASA